MMMPPHYSIRINPLYAGLAASRLESFMRALPRTFATEGELVFRNRRNELRRFSVDCGLDAPLSVVVKRYKKPNLFQRCASVFTGGLKGAKAFRNGLEFLSRGFLTPTPVAALEVRHGLVWIDSYYACAECTWPTARPLFESADGDVVRREAFLDAVARYAAALHGAGIIHGDLNDTNIYYDTADDGFRFTIIDINRMRFYDGLPPRRACLKDLMRLCKSIETLTRITTRYATIRQWDMLTTLRQELRYKQRLNDKFARKDKFKRLRALFRSRS